MINKKQDEKKRKESDFNETSPEKETEDDILPRQATPPDEFEFNNIKSAKMHYKDYRDCLMDNKGPDRAEINFDFVE